MTPIYQITVYQCGKMLCADLEIASLSTGMVDTIPLEPHSTITGLMDSVAIAINDRKEGGNNG